MQWGLDLACTHIGWPLGRVLAVDPDAEGQLATQIWHDEDPARHRPFVEAPDSMRFATSAGLSKRVVADSVLRYANECDVGAGLAARRSALGDRPLRVAGETLE
jgi:hypothetical protein